MILGRAVRLAVVLVAGLLLLAACSPSPDEALPQGWREATRARLDDLVVDATPFPAVLTPLPEDQAEIFTTSVAMTVAIAAGEDPGPSAERWIDGFWDPEMGLFHGMGPPPEVESYFAVLVLTHLGDRPLASARAAGILDWAASSIWVDPTSGESFDLTSDLDWIGDLFYRIRLVDLVGRTAEAPAVRERAAAILVMRRDDLEAVCGAVGEKVDPDAAALLVDVTMRAGGECDLPDAARHRVASWFEERLDSVGVEMFIAAIDALERGGYLAQGATLEAIRRAESEWSRAEPQPGAFAWQTFDLAAPTAHRLGYRLVLPGWMWEELRREIARGGAIPDIAEPHAPATARAIHALALAGDDRSADEWWERVAWERLEPSDRLWLALAIDPSRLDAGNVEAVPVDTASPLEDVRVVSLAFQMAELPCDAPVASRLVEWAKAAELPDDVAGVRDLAETLMGVEPCDPSGVVTKKKQELTTTLGELEDVDGVAAWMPGDARDVMSGWLGVEARCALTGRPDLAPDSLRVLAPEFDPDGMVRWSGGLSVDATYAVLRIDEILTQNGCGGAWWAGLNG